ncbi:MAG: hypothetical protein Q4P72_05120 [Eubacteriales bacterium]|nr:hypothetical protein [Eubacteriales bacterium]
MADLAKNDLRENPDLVVLKYKHKIAPENLIYIPKTGYTSLCKQLHIDRKTILRYLDALEERSCIKRIRGCGAGHRTVIVLYADALSTAQELLDRNNCNNFEDVASVKKLVTERYGRVYPDESLRIENFDVATFDGHLRTVYEVYQSIHSYPTITHKIQSMQIDGERLIKHLSPLTEEHLWYVAISCYGHEENIYNPIAYVKTALFYAVTTFNSFSTKHPELNDFIEQMMRLIEEYKTYLAAQSRPKISKLKLLYGDT